MSTMKSKVAVPTAPSSTFFATANGMPSSSGPFRFAVDQSIAPDLLAFASTQRQAALRALGDPGPPRWLLQYPGSSPDSEKTLRDLLRRDFEEHHIYWNSIRWHNHLLHHAVVIFTLGAQPERLIELFQQHASFARPLMKTLLAPIDRSNWINFVGEEQSYSSYLLFFLAEIDALGPVGTIERYIFTAEANQPGVAMLARLFSGILHPIIHLGHALETGGNDSLAQALSETAVSHMDMANLYPSEEVIETLALEPTSSVAVAEYERQHTVGAIPTLDLSPRIFEHYQYDGANAFEVFANLDAETGLDDCGDIKAGDTVIAGAHSHGHLIGQIAKQWTVDINKGWQEIEVKSLELLWLITSIFGITSSPNEQLKMDFFFCHLQTPLFTHPIVLPLLKPSSRVAFLTMHFRTACCSWTSRGKPPFRFADLLLHPSRRRLAVPRPSFNPDIRYTELRQDWETEIEEHNLWYKIGQRAMMHLDEHVAKSLRVLMWCGTALGSHYNAIPTPFQPRSAKLPNVDKLPLFTPRGTMTANVEEGQEWGARKRQSVCPQSISAIDQSLFVRTALLVLEALPIIDKERAKRFKDAYKHDWSLLPIGREAAYRLDVWALLGGREATPKDPPR